MKALKVGLLVSSTFSDKYVRELALWAKDREDIRISHLIVHPGPRDSRLGRLRNLLGQGPYVLLTKILFRLIVSVETLFLKRTGLHGDHYQTFDLRQLVDEVLTVTPIDSESFPFTTATIESTEEVPQDSGNVITNGLRRDSLSSASPKSSMRGMCWSEVPSRRGTFIP